MKKLTLSLMAILMILPLTVKADWVKEVSNKSEIVAAFNAFENTPGCVDKIIVKGDDATLIDIGNYTMGCDSIRGGKLIVTSEQTDITKVPQLKLGFNFKPTAADQTENPSFSMIWENVGLQYRAGATASSGQIFYANVAACAYDSVIFRNCDINNIARCLYRSVPDYDTIWVEEGNPDASYELVRKTYPINYFEMSGCKAHNMCISSGNGWGVIYFGQCTKEITFRNNLWYDIPYAKALIYWGYIDSTGETPNVTFSNNSVFWGSGSLNSGKPVFDAGGYLGDMTTYNFDNNIFSYPEGGEFTQTAIADTARYDSAAVALRQRPADGGGLIYFNNNISRGYKAFGDESSVGAYYDFAETNTYTWEESGLKWEDFYSANEGDFRLLKSNPLYTMGVDGAPIGADFMYVDEFPVEIKVNVEVTGVPFAGYTINPSKAKYFKDDHITISATAHNSFFRTFADFQGWSNGETSEEIEMDLTGEELEINLVGTYAPVGQYVAAFDFSDATKGSVKSTNDALSEIYFNMDQDDKYQAKLFQFMVDTVGLSAGEASYELYSSRSTDNTRNFECRYGQVKFGEDDESERQGIVSRRTPTCIKDEKADFVVVEFNTKGFKGLNFSCFVGTDNNANKTQELYYSLDCQDWKKLTSVDLEAWQWFELAADLPAECDNQDSIFVKITGVPCGFDDAVMVTDQREGMGPYTWVNDVTPETKADNTFYYKDTDRFEYTGNIALTYQEYAPVAGKKGDANGDNVVDVADITAIASYILGSVPTGFNTDNADVNGDNVIDVADITGTAAIILGE